MMLFAGACKMEADLLGIGVGSIMAGANDLPRRLTGEIIVL
jgi:hypothetical protein